MSATAARLLRLLTLLQTRRHWAGQALAERLEVHPRTLRRDVERLRTLGYPVHASSGVAGGYALRSGAAMPPLMLDDDEALVAALALRTAATLGTAGALGSDDPAGDATNSEPDAGSREEVALRVLVKLEQAMPVTLRARVQALRAVTVPLALPMAAAPPAIDANHLATLACACRDQSTLGFDYVDARGRASTRQVEPQGLVHTGTCWYLVAWDRLREDWRSFRVDRIAGAPTPGAHFAPRGGPEGGDLRAYVARAVATAPQAEQARVRLHAPRARMAQCIPPWAGTLEELPDGHCLLVCGATRQDSLAYWLLTLEVEFDVLAPPTLIAHLRDAAERLARTLARQGAG